MTVFNRLNGYSKREMGCDVHASMTIFAHTDGCTHTLEAQTRVEEQIFIQGPRTQIPETDWGQRFAFSASQGYEGSDARKPRYGT